MMRIVMSRRARLCQNKRQDKVIIITEGQVQRALYELAVEKARCAGGVRVLSQPIHTRD